MTNFFGTPIVMSEHGAAVDKLMWLIHGLMILLFVGWLIYFLVTLFKFRGGQNRPADPLGVRNKYSTVVELGIVAAEGALLVGLALPLWKKNVEGFPPEKDSTVIEVMGRQFNWTAHYAGPDGIMGRKDPKLVNTSDPFGIDRKSPGAADDVVVVNDFVVPVQRPVIAKITSLDVIHSFTVRPMRAQQDAIPGMMIPIHFKPVKTGTNNITCAQLCGNSHYAMKGTLAVVSQAQFNDWIKTKSKAAPTAPVSYE